MSRWIVLLVVLSACAHQPEQLTADQRATMCEPRPSIWRPSDCLGSNQPVVSMGDVVALSPEATFSVTVDGSGTVRSVHDVVVLTAYHARGDARRCVERWLKGRTLTTGIGVPVRLTGGLGGSGSGVWLEACAEEGASAITAQAGARVPLSRRQAAGVWPVQRRNERWKVLGSL